MNPETLVPVESMRNLPTVPLERAASLLAGVGDLRKCGVLDVVLGGGDGGLDLGLHGLDVVVRLVEEGLLLTETHLVALPLVWSFHSIMSGRTQPERRSSCGTCEDRGRTDSIDLHPDVPIHARGSHG